MPVVRAARSLHRGSMMNPTQRLFSLAVATASLAACFYNPTDGSEVGAYRPDGLPSAVDLSGYGVADRQLVSIEMFDHGAGTWEEVTTAHTAESELLTTGLFPWEVPGFRIPEERFLADGTLPDAGTPGRYARFRALYGEKRIHMLTFDAQGKACVDDALAAGKDPASAGQACATGNELTLWWDAQTGTPGKRVQLEVEQWPCAAPTILTGLPEEADHLAATRFDPPAYPFAVDTVSYVLLHDPTGSGLSYGCDATMAHEVRFYRSRTEVPLANPELVATRIVTGSPTTEPQEVFTTVELDVPVVLEEGEYLFVAVQFPRPDFTGVCIEACDIGSAYEPNRHFWSYAVAPPYDWREFSTFAPWATLMWVDGYSIGE